MSVTLEHRIEHAKAYPFPAPDHGFLYEAGSWRRLEEDDLERNGRVPVLAAGSNQSPEQLIRKYGGMEDIGPIPVQRGRLHDFDVVYAAHLTAYGSLPATFQRSPGTLVTVFVLWLNAAQLARMHETERNYSYDRLDRVAIEFDDGATRDHAFAYSSKIGCYSHDGNCISLAEIAAEGRNFEVFDQPSALSLVRDRLSPGVPLDRFLGQHLEDRELHKARSSALGQGAIPTAYQRTTIVTL